MGRVLRIAAGSNDKTSFNISHFGESRYFMIYDIYDDGDIIFKEARINDASDMEEEMHGDPRKFSAVISQLTDIDIMLAYAMGPNFKRIVESSDKIPYIIKGVGRKTKQIIDGLKETAEKFDELYDKLSVKRSKRSSYLK